MGVAVGDVNSDGYPDAYLTNYGEDRNYLNQGNRSFVDVSRAAGIGARHEPALGVTCIDFNGDHWPDIYVVNDQTANFLWSNQRTQPLDSQALVS